MCGGLPTSLCCGWLAAPGGSSFVSSRLINLGNDRMKDVGSSSIPLEK
jgi:argininosuccinate synthase